MSENNLVASGLAWLRGSAVGKLVTKLATPEPKKQVHSGPVREVSSEMLADGSEIVKYSDGRTRHFRFDSLHFQEKFGSSRLPNLGEGDDVLTHEQRSIIGSCRGSSDAELEGVLFKDGPFGANRGTPVDPELKEKKRGWQNL